MHLSIHCLFSFLFLLPIGVFGQLTTDSNAPYIDSTSGLPVYQIVETLPTVVGGKAALFSTLGKNLSIPADRAPVMGKLNVAFVVTKTGAVVGGRSFGSTLPNDPIALQVLEQVALQKWNPGFQDGLPVNVLMLLPVQICWKN